MIKVLDHGFVRLVSYTQPTGAAADWSGDLEIVRNARVSFDSEWRTGEDEGKDSRLLGRLLRDHHTSPFEAMVFTFEVKAPIFVFRQWHRHRTWSYNEVSARYSELPEEYYIPEALNPQTTSNKQGRDESHHIQGQDDSLHSMIRHSQNAFLLYKDLLDRGVSRELARTVLPLSTYSRMFATVDLHNLLHFLRLRLHAHAQYEIRVYAVALLELISPIVPVVAEHFRKEMSLD